MSEKAPLGYIKVTGAVFELWTINLLHGKRNDKLYRRLFVSPEFVSLYYKLSDGEFDDNMFDALSKLEKHMLSTAANFTNINVRGLNIAISKLMRDSFTRLKVIEGAILAGNLNHELVNEYIAILREMGELGLIPRLTATKQIRAMGRTFKAQQKSNEEATHI